MNTEKPVWHGILLVAGGAIGAGMFALPFAAAGAWFLWAVLGFVFIWFLSFWSASLLAKVNIALVSEPEIPLTASCSFDSLVNYSLGKQWTLVNNLCIMFIMSILMYAYTTAGANIIGFTAAQMGMDKGLVEGHWLRIGFALLIATAVWFGTAIVSRVSLLLMLVMSGLFAAVVVGIFPQVEFDRLWQVDHQSEYLFSALPVFLTAFACAGLVPTLVRHYQHKPINTHRSLLWGTVIALLVYLLWTMVTLGAIDRIAFAGLIGQGSNVADLVSTLISQGASDAVRINLSSFSHLAIITSFLSVGIGFFHFMQDKLGLSTQTSRRLLALLCCFGPPLIASVLFPYGFVYAIGFAGLFVAFSFFVLPAMMAFRLSSRGLLASSKTQPFLVFVFGIVMIVLKVALLLQWLPTFKG